MLKTLASLCTWILSLAIFPACAQDASTPPMQEQQPVTCNASKDFLPQYPSESKLLAETGIVLVNVKISAGGVAEKISLHKSSGFPRLDAAAMGWLQRKCYDPTGVDARFLNKADLFPVKFTIQD